MSELKNRQNLISELCRLEKKVTNLLQEHAKDEYSKDVVAFHVAKTSLLMNHLYQDLGFLNRTQMGRFTNEHFPTLAAKKPKETLWKKFIYDCVGEVAPACATCNDQLNCFTCKSS
jgi:nitrogen fixation protein NifQ